MKNLYKIKTSLLFIFVVFSGVVVRAQALTTDYPWGIVGTSAHIAATVTDVGTGIKEKGVCYSTSANPTIANSTVLATGMIPGSFDVLLSNLIAGTTYHARAYIIRSGDNAVFYGADLLFITYSAVTYPYTCKAINDGLINESTYQFDIYMYSNSSGNELYLNSYQLAFKVWNVELSQGVLTGSYVAASSDLGADFMPSGSVTFRPETGDYWDMIIAGPPASSNGERIPYSAAGPGTRIGTFQIVHHSTQGGPETAFPTGIKLDMIWDNNDSGKTFVYASSSEISGTISNNTDYNAHSPLSAGTPLYNYYLNVANWKGGASGDVNNWNNASNWVANPDPIAVPPSSTSLVPAYIPGSGITYYPVISTRTVPTCSDLVIVNGGNVTIAPGGDLTVTGTLTNESGTTGLLIQSDASGSGSLIHNTNNVNATIQRYITGSSDLTAMMYHTVSVPLTSTSSPTSNQFLDAYLFNFPESTNNWVSMGTSTTTALDVKQGYMVYYPGAAKTFSFEGLMNNGGFTAFTECTDPTTKGFNLVPNPYPSTIDWNIVTGSGWTKTQIDNSIYVWNSTLAAPQYASFVGGVSINGGSKYIAPGQAFFVHTNVAGSASSLVMDNRVRLHNTGGFLKDEQIIPDLLRINMIADGAVDETVIRFMDGATPTFDSDWDAYKLPGSINAPQLSSVSSDNQNLSINSLPKGGAEVIVPLDFSFSSTIDVTLTASGMETFNPNTPIYLEDMTLNKTVNLVTNPVYTFTYQTSDPNDRFLLRFEGASGTNERTDHPGKAFISNNKIFIEVPGMEGYSADITVYNMLGQIMDTNHLIMTGVVSMDAPLNSGIYVVDVASSDQHFVTKVINK